MSDSDMPFKLLFDGLEEPDEFELCGDLFLFDKTTATGMMIAKLANRIPTAMTVILLVRFNNFDHWWSYSHIRFLIFIRLSSSGSS
jgi:hypothetical protein